MADRAVSTVLGYVLTLAVVTLLISGLFLAAGNYVEAQQERVIRAQLEVVGNRLAADIAAVDRLALAADGGGRAELVSPLPSRAAGKSYRIDISAVAGSTGVHHLNLSTTNPDVSVEVRVRVGTTLDAGTVEGGRVVVGYNGTAIEVRDG